MTKLSRTARELVRMLTENTGTHFMDSGGDSGRMWQRNQGKNFMKEPEAYWGYLDDLCATKSTFHFLRNTLEYDTEANRWFSRLKNKEWRDKYGVEVIQCWMDLMMEKAEERGQDCGGIYGEGEPFITNTCNGEDALSQVLQFGYYTLDGEEYVVLQIHGGADVRGGYTDPIIFQLTEEAAIFDNARLSAGCNNTECSADEHGNVWDTTDGGCNWECVGEGPNLDKLELVSVEEPWKPEPKEDWSKQTEIPLEDERAKPVPPTKLVKFENRKEGEASMVYCPYCGGELWVGNY